MSMQPEANAPEPDGLQFDHAEFNETQVPSNVACAGCRQPIVDHYYEINGMTLCDPCRERIDAQLRGGSGLLRFIRAIIFGSAAALLGTIIYVIFLSISPVDIAIVAILIGFMVGKMVRKGSQNRGGLSYQFLAVFLTYSALALTYLTLWVIAQAQHPQAAPAAPANPPAIVKQRAPKAQAQPADVEADEALDPAPKLDFSMIITMIGLAYTVPILLIKQSPIMIAFVGFAIWEAWKSNRRLPLVVTGPYLVGDAEPSGGMPAHA